MIFALLTIRCALVGDLTMRTSSERWTESTSRMATGRVMSKRIDRLEHFD
jgi:hypothetical protein